MGDDSSVRVAVRIRPQVARELIDMCRICTQVPPGEPQVFLGPDKAFTYDYVFDTGVGQNDIYDDCVARLIEGALDGYNATVLAYGQTGSGKTYTMGTGFDVEVDDSIVGIIPRAIKHLFDGICDKQNRARERAQMPPEFKITAQFLELYNEDLKDLLEPGGPRGGARIHEDTNGNIHLAGVEPRIVTNPEQALEYLKLGALSRTTGSTQMNTQSSRSHAIFTLFIKQQRCIKIEDPDADVDTSEPTNEFETLTAKFHFVDLAGSERLKRTGATGERAKEGISINCGLLALGNVISALGDKNKKALHVPYRDSKLTRLLQDSLGGNSQTVMIACVSPSDRDFMETLSTLKYANRARNIKNKVTINQDKSSRTILSLRQEIQQLQIELLEYRQGKRIVGEDGVNDAWHENQMLTSELQSLKTRVKALSETVEALTAKNSLLLAEKASAQWLSTNSNNNGNGNEDVTSLVLGYVQEIEELSARLLEAEAMYQQLKKRQLQLHNVNNTYCSGIESTYSIQNDTNSVLVDAKKELQKELNALAALKKQQSMSVSTNMNISSIINKSNNNNNNNDYDDDDNDIDNTENGQESLSDDDSDDDSDRKEDDEEEEENENEEQVAIRRELEAITTDIDVRQRLIQELELSHRRLQTMKQHYEDKLTQLQARIKDTQDERDKVLSSLVQQSSPLTEKVKKLRDEYEKKLSSMQKEMRLLQSAKKEHARLLKNQSQSENRLRGLRNELSEMKRAKVKLLNKMKEESKKHKENELRRNREIAQLRKESRKNANMIRTLEADKKMKEVVLRRKQEEVTALRKRDRGLSNKVAGRTNIKTTNQKTLKYKWKEFEKIITKQALAKQAVAETEREMEKLLIEREELGKDLEKLQKHRKIVETTGGDTIEIDEDIDNYKSKISYVQDSIAECQRDMVEIGDCDVESEPGIEALINAVKTIDEAQFLLQRMLTFTVEQSCSAAQKQLEVRDMESRLNEVAQESDVQHQLLEHVLRNRDLLDISNNNNNNSNNNTTAYSPPSSRSSSPDNSENYNQLTLNVESKQKSNKVRRRTTQPQELLYGLSSSMISDNLKVEDQNQNQNQNHPLTRVPSAPGSLRGLLFGRGQNTSGTAGGNSPVLSRRDSTSPKLPRRPLYPSGPPGGYNGSMEQLAQMDAPSPPGSPTIYRRFNTREENVFSRLTAAKAVPVDPQPTKGVISQYPGKTQPRAPLQCTHIAEGHSKAVLAIDSTEDLLFSGSKDRTVKVWDLGSGLENMTLTGHPNNVVAVKYSLKNHLLFSVSAAYVKVWDLRSGNNCVKTLFSSGQSQSGPLSLTTPARTLQLPVGEMAINDLSLSLDEQELYTAAGDKITVWDLRKLSCVRRLSTPHTAAVMCLSAAEDGRVITGSKDHLISLVDASLSGQSVSLAPPHYDGVQCLATIGSILFSGSRDMCIKRWDLNRMELIQSLNNAHKDWILGLCTINEGSIMVSGCRGGILRAWTVPSELSGECSLIGEVRAHGSAINAVITNQQHIFTASNDGTVRLWSYSKREHRTFQRSNSLKC